MQRDFPTDLNSAAAARQDGYEPVARAIDYLVENFEARPSLDETAAAVGLSATHFQRVFAAGAGVSPKRFLQYLAAGAARRSLLRGASVLEAAFDAGLSGSSRLHDLFLTAEAMTPGAYRRRGDGETIRYALVPGPFGAALVGATEKGICWLSFGAEAERARQMEELTAEWPAAAFMEDAAFIVPIAEAAYAHVLGGRREGSAAVEPGVRLHVMGSNFQIRVWEALLRIPPGACVTYGDVAAAIGAPGASRAVGAAVGANPISLLIPCHRVILASGAVHNYRWGAARKQALLALESARESALESAGAD